MTSTPGRSPNSTGRPTRCRSRTTSLKSRPRTLFPLTLKAFPEGHDENAPKTGNRKKNLEKSILKLPHPNFQLHFIAISQAIFPLLYISCFVATSYHYTTLYIPTNFFSIPISTNISSPSSFFVFSSLLFPGHLTPLQPAPAPPLLSRKDHVWFNNDVSFSRIFPLSVHLVFLLG